MFDRSLTIDDQGRTIVDMGPVKAVVEVAEFTYYVRDVWQRDGVWEMALNDGTTERLEPGLLVIEGDGRIIVGVKDGRHRARLLRHAYHALAMAMDYDETEGTFTLEAEGTVHHLATGSLAT